MAVVIVRLKGNKQGGCNRNERQATTSGTTQGTATATKVKNTQPQRVVQRAAAVLPQTTAAAATTAAAEKTSEVSYMTAFTLVAVVGGIYLISQYKGK